MPLLYVLKTDDIVIMEGSELQCYNNFENVFLSVFAIFITIKMMTVNLVIIIMIITMMRVFMQFLIEEEDYVDFYVVFNINLLQY